jgi:hypothetical protein
LYRDDRSSHFLDLGLEAEYLTLLEKYLSISLGRDDPRPALILSYMDTSDVRVSFIDEDIGSFEVYTPSPHALHLFTEELQSSLILFDDFVVEEGFFVLCEDDLPIVFLDHVEIIDKCMKKQLAFLLKYDKIS